MKTEGKIMKKILFATTALVATASVAAADVSFSGYARFGLSYNDGTEEVTNASRFRIQADVSTETDSGMTLNARQRFQTEENSTGGLNGIRFGASMGAISVNLGNINGVIESAPNLYMSTKSAGVGLEGNGFASLAVNTAAGAWGWTAYSSGGAGATNGIELVYSASGMTVHVANVKDTSMGVGASYAMGDTTVAVALEDFDNGDSIMFASAGTKIGAANIAIAYGDTDLGGVTADKISLKGGTSVGAATNVYGFVASEDAGEAFGLGVSHGLGGGASFEAGWTRNEAEVSTISAGIFFNF